MACILSQPILSVTGDCSNTNSGAFNISINGTAPDYSIQWISPFTGTTALGPGVTTYGLTSLSAGTYTFEVVDSCAPINTVQTVNVYISSGTCLSITDIQDTVCGLDNGSLTATTQNFYGIANFYLYETTLGYINSGSSLTNSWIFNSLPSGIYYVTGDDGGGCSGTSETCIIKDSENFSFGFYKVDNAGCASVSGALYITGLTGTPPYTYLWTPGGQTTSSITGLTAGSYGVTVTDSTGCVNSSGATIVTIPPVGLGTFIVTQPSCFTDDGEVEVIITGGTAPFYYSGSNGVSTVSFSSSYTFSGVGTGLFTVKVTDAGLCNFTSSTTLVTPQSFNVVSISTTNSMCSNNGGSILIVIAGTGVKTFTIDNGSGYTSSQVSTTNSVSFTSLPSGTYSVTISGGPCTYTTTTTINNTSLFDLTVNTTGTTCNEDNGSAELIITTGGTPPYIFEIQGVESTTPIVSLSNLFINLPSGNYIAQVTDSTPCTQLLSFNVPVSNTVDFTLVGTDPVFAPNGTVTAYITSGTPPFVLNWSSNVNGQTGMTVSNLSAGTYTLTITDDIGCVQTRTVILNGFNNVSSYQVYNICNDDFTNQGIVRKKGLNSMLIEGFNDLTTGDTNCIINTAVFTAQVIVSGNSKVQSFYTSTGLGDYPADYQWYETVESLLLSFDNITNVIVDPLNNQFKISGCCNDDSSIVINLIINYDISCVSCEPITCGYKEFEDGECFEFMDDSTFEFEDQ